MGICPNENILIWDGPHLSIRIKVQLQEIVVTLLVPKYNNWSGARLACDLTAYPCDVKHIIAF